MPATPNGLIGRAASLMERPFGIPAPMALDGHGKNGAGGRNRTGTSLRIQHFKCCASTSFATPAQAQGNSNHALPSRGLSCRPGDFGDRRHFGLLLAWAGLSRRTLIAAALSVSLMCTA